VTARSESTSSHLERVPLHFRCLGIGCEDVEYAAETVQIWLYGFLMRSRRELTAGTMLYLRLRVPIEISGSPFSEMRRIGQDVSEHKLEDGLSVTAWNLSARRAALGPWTWRSSRGCATCSAESQRNKASRARPHITTIRALCHCV